MKKMNKKFYKILMMITSIIILLGCTYSVAEQSAETGIENEEYALGIKEAEQGNIMEAMEHLLLALPNKEAEAAITRYAPEYVDELMFAEEYQNAQTFMIEHPFDGSEQLLAECNDHCFLLDLASGMMARIRFQKADDNWPDKKKREHLQQVSSEELKYLEKYISFGFSDSQLADYAYTYIGALQSEITGATFYGTDTEKYNEYYEERGVNVRCRMTYLINKKYGIELPDGYNMNRMLNYGKNLDYVFAVERMLKEQLADAEIEWNYTTSNKLSINFDNITLVRNTSGYTLENLVSIKILFFDANGKQVDYGYISLVTSSNEKVTDGKYLPASGYHQIDEPFSSIAFRCEITDLDFVRHEFMVYPRKTTSWNGQGSDIVIDGSTISEEKVSLEDIKAYWTMQNDHFIPCVSFVLRNSGNTDITEADVDCIFIDADKNVEWSREKNYVVSTYDVPLRSGLGRSVIAYSHFGYEKKTKKVPNIYVEIYVNGVALNKIEVERP